MKNLISFLALALIAVTFTACDSGLTESASAPADEDAVLAKQDKFGICHWDEYAQEFIPINVAEPAVAAHFANHGDFYSYNDSCECPCFSEEDLAYELGISSGYQCGSGNGVAGARVLFRYSGVAQDPYQAKSASRGGPSCTSPGDGGVSGFADELATMCINLVLDFCD